MTQRSGEWVEFLGKFWRNVRTGQILPIIQGGALPASDSFTGTTGTQLETYSASWTINSGAFDIQTNRVALDDTSGAVRLAHWNADAFDDNQYAKITIICVTGYVLLGPSVRCAASADTGYAYVVSVGANWAALTKNIAGETTYIRSVDGGGRVVSGDVLKLEANGTTLTPKIDDVTDSGVGAQTDASIGSGSAGIAGLYSSGTRTTEVGDDWEGGNLGGAATNITVAECKQAQASDAVTLGVYTPIAPSQQNQAQASDLVSLSLAITALTAAEDNQAQVSDAVSLTSEAPTYQLSAAECNQAQVSDTVTLGVFTPIAAAEDNQAQVSDAASLTAEGPTYNITPAEGNQGQADDAASVTVQGATRWTTYWTTQFNQDQEAWVTLAHIAGTIRLWGRMVNPTGGGVNLRGYFAEYQGGTVTAHRYNDTGAVDIGLGTATVTLADNDKLWLRLEGAQVSVYTYQSGAWSQQISVTDASPALEDGYIGFDVTDATAILDDFGGGALTVNITPAQNNQAQASDAASLTAEGPTANITVADDTQVQVSDEATLGVIHVITPAEDNQAQVSDAATITSGEVSIAPAQANQAQVSDAALLGVWTPITVAEANQVQASDAASITFSGIELVNITVSESWQAQTSDAATLGVYTPIAPAQANQAQASDAVSLTAEGPTFTISVSEAAQAQASDPALIYSITPITPAEAWQAQVSDTASLSLGGLITHGTRHLYQVNMRKTGQMATRVTHSVNTRKDYEVDD